MVKVNNAAKAGEGTVWFDYFNVTHAVSASASPPKKASHAALIGGVTAGVVVFIIAAAVLLVYFRRKRTHRSSLSGMSCETFTSLTIPAETDGSVLSDFYHSSARSKSRSNVGIRPTRSFFR
jgi:hypothetical protein